MPRLGIPFAEKMYVWSMDTDQSHTRMREAQYSASRLLSGLLFGKLVVLGLIALFLIYLQGFDLIFTLSFWLEPSWAGVFVYLTILCGLGLYAHQSQTVKTIPAMPEAQELLEPIPLAQEAQMINISDFFSEDAKKSVERAYDLATNFGHAHVDPLHLFIGTIDTQEIAVVFSRLGLTFETIQEPIGRKLQTREFGKPPILSESAERVLLEAFRQAVHEHVREVNASELFACAYKQDLFLQEVFLDNGIDTVMFENMLEWLRIHEKMRERYKQFQKAAYSKPTGAMNRSMTSVATPLLDAVSEDLTTAAVQGHLPMLIDRDKEIEEIFRVIEGGGQSVVLVGSEGVGKTALIAGIAELMVQEDVPSILQDKRLVRISIPHLVSGVDASQAQDRLLQVFYEVSRSKNIILVINDIDQIVSQGSAGATDLAATLVDFLSRGGTFALATTTPQAYTALVERSMIGRIFQKVLISEPDQQTAIHILESKIGGIEYEQNVIFSYEAVEKAVKLSDRYMHETYLPKKAIEIARETALQVAKTKGVDALVTGQDIAAIISSKTGIPTTSVGEDEKTKLLSLETHMHGRVIGQDEAVNAIASALRRARTELRSGSRPIATFLFLGPTGVGKTELAKTVAETYFGSENKMIRLDMSEYQDTSS